MKLLGTFVVFAFLVCCCIATKGWAQEQIHDGGFRELLEIVGIEPAALNKITDTELTEADWEVVAQLIERLTQHQAELSAWTLSNQVFTPGNVGELFEINGTVESIERLSSVKEVSGLEHKPLYRCNVKLDKGISLVVLSVNIPSRWNISQPINERVSLQGVLLRADAKPLLLTTHLNWFPTSDLPSGQLLLARFGMDAGLWDFIKQRAPFISPANGREAEAFYSCLAAFMRIPASELANAALARIAETAVLTADEQEMSKLERQVAASLKEQAAMGLSSVAPLFLKPETEVGELVRLQGTARRAVRIAVDDPTALALQPPVREYFELELFTADSQNLPIVCCVTRLPPEFPTGDAIRESVRLDGVFFKSWQYRTRKLVDGAGETGTQQQRYTPVVLGASVTWLQQVPAERNWWGLVVGGSIFAVMILGLIRLVISYRRDRRPRLPDSPPDFSELS
jgi:hypothetical protein